MTSELISQGEEDTVPWFDMQYNTQNACPIVDSGTLIVTGGSRTQRTVSRYDTAGFVEDLPALNEGRGGHGCGGYTGDTGEQVFLVTGGYNGGYLSSTEVWSPSSSSWTMATNLPRSMIGVRGVTLGGVLYMTGGADDGYNYYDDIYQWTGAD